MNRRQSPTWGPGLLRILPDQLFSEVAVIACALYSRVSLGGLFKFNSHNILHSLPIKLYRTPCSTLIGARFLKSIPPEAPSFSFFSASLDFVVPFPAAGVVVTRAGLLGPARWVGPAGANFLILDGLGFLLSCLG